MVNNISLESKPCVFLFHITPVQVTQLKAAIFYGEAVGLGFGIEKKVSTVSLSDQNEASHQGIKMAQLA